MLPRHNKIPSSKEFSSAMRGSTKAGTRRVVVYHSIADSKDEVAPGQPRVGLIVSKAVGNAVTRHRVARRLRHISARLIATEAAGTRIIIRALPSSATASSAELDDDIRSALRRISRRRMTRGNRD